MRATRDTFLHFLADNLTGRTVWPIRKSSTDPAKSKLKENAVNVQFLTMTQHMHIAGTLVSIDILHQDELTAVDITQEVWQLLSSAFYTPNYDYTNPNSPVATGENIYWDNDSVVFKPIDNSPNYMHFNCTMELRHKI